MRDRTTTRLERLSKLELRERTQVVVIAYESGLVTPGRHDVTD